jgi:maleylacetate reductase
VIVRWGLAELPGLLAELEIRRPLLVASRRWDRLELGSAARWDEIPSDRVAVPDGIDAILGVGGGSAIDTAKAASAMSALPLVSVPTTYAGAEWTTFFGVRDPSRKIVGGGGGARPVAILYAPELTLDLPRAASVGTAMNALAHCAEALYARGRREEGDSDAIEGAALIAESLPRVVEHPEDLEARRRLLEGAMHAGAALAVSGFALAHAMAQALGGRYGIPHGALNAICLPPALRFNEAVAGEAINRFGEAMGTSDPVGRVEELARLGGFTRLRELGVPADELDEVGVAVAGRPAAKANPRPASPAEIAALMRSVY